jgi:1-acyl-sn-glycerol-3-phosphate acyltransferase
MKNVLGRFFALYALLLFIVTMIPVLIWLWLSKIACMIFPTMIFEKILFATFRIWMGIFLPLIGCPLTVYGKEKFKSNQKFVVIVNHNSLLDIPISSPYIPGIAKTLGKDSFAKVPLFGFIYKAGSILVNRGNAKSRAESYGKMKACLEQGFHLCLYPEGTRNKTDQPLQKFHDGAFKVAIDAQVPLLPAIIKGTKAAMPANKFFYLWPTKISFTFLEEINTTGKMMEDVTELKKLAWERMKEELNNFTIKNRL